MTLNELKNSVIDLGFEVGLDKEEMLIPALARALHTIYLDRPRLSTAVIGIPRIDAAKIAGHIYHRGGDSIVIPLSGVAYSFRVSGRGKYILNSGSLTREEEFDGDMLPLRGSFTREATLTFLGEYSYDVYSLSVFQSVRGPREEDIPIYGEERIYDLIDAIPDLLGIYSAPRDERGCELPGVYIQGGALHLPEDFEGKVFIKYKRAPYVATGDDMEEEIDLPRETEELLPLLVASYLWLDDDAEKAQYYMSLYRLGISTLQRAGGGSTNSKYETNGWA